MNGSINPAALAHQAYERIANTLSLVRALSTSEAFADTEMESCLESIVALLQ
jgi:hypothetical protein